jgi:hypothetical protein
MTLLESLQAFATNVATKSNQLTSGEPEDQLRSPFENLMTAAATVIGGKAVCTGETKLQHRVGRPDFAVHFKGLLAGYVELKAPGTGANPKRYAGHNRDQWKRFQSLPNLIYCDGNEWALYRGGERVGRLVRMSGDILADGKKAVVENDALALENLLRDFFTWEPTIPVDRKGKIDLKAFAQLLAPLCRMLRAEVTDALGDNTSPLVKLAADWRQLLFPDASDEKFADAYAQTVAFALLLGRAEGADPLTLNSAEAALAAEHSLLSRALQVLTDPVIQNEMKAPLDMMLRVIAVVPAATLSGPEDPWLYFYEDFLAAYDPKLRKDVGAYYTPIEVVRAQVRLIDDLLVNRLGKPLGFADPAVITLDPAAGTGTYLLGVIEHALSRVEAEQGKGAVPGRATTLAANLHGFEIMVGPYAVTELRTSRALRDRGASLPKDGTNIYLTDTLESPNAEFPQGIMGFAQKEFAEQHRRATKVKAEVSVIVCLGNPPYDRHDAFPRNTDQQLSKWGGWVRFGDPLADKDARLAKMGKKKTSKKKQELTRRQAMEIREQSSILSSGFVSPAKKAGHGVHIKNLYNLYVYFWRWALWKVFEQDESRGPGIVSFITASSYLDGDAFCGMREKMRRECDEIWILDLGGEGRGTRQTDNVFAIQIPVAIAVAVRSKETRKNTPAKVHYARVDGTRDAKLSALDAIRDSATIKWQKCPSDWQSAFRPAGKGEYFSYPPLTDLMPLQLSGAMPGRTWVIAPEVGLLRHRWETLCATKSESRSVFFKESPTGRKVSESPRQLLSEDNRLTPIVKLSLGAAMPNIVRYMFRSFDRQYLIADARVLDRPGPTLWEAYGPKQVFITTILSHVLGRGPAALASHEIPDRNYFCNRAGASFPLYRDSAATEPNILPGMLQLLAKTYKRKVTPEDFVAYIYGALAQPAFTERFSKELETRELRVPFTKDKALFESVRQHGAHLLWLHTYGERFVPKGKRRGRVPPGVAKCLKSVPETKEGYPENFDYNDETRTLLVGDGEFGPVSPEVYGFEVSGLKVVQSWLKYRMKKGAGKKSSPLDDIRPEHWTAQFTTELLELLWVLEATVAGYPEQAKLLDEVVSGPCFTADELPVVPAEMRKPPKGPSKNRDLFG